MKVIRATVRNIGKGDKYDDKEKEIYDKVVLHFTTLVDSKLPHELQMETADGLIPCHTITPTDCTKSFWVPKLRQGPLTTEVSRMIGDITDYMSYRVSLNYFKNGHFNDIWYLLCYHLIKWLSEQLSGAKCRNQTLEMVQKYHNFLTTLRETNAFRTNDDHGEAGKTMLNVMTRLIDSLTLSIIPKIKGEIANFHIRQHIRAIRISGKSLLYYLSQFCYYAFRKTRKVPPFNMAQLPKVILATRSGKLLEVLFKTPYFRKIFELGPTASGASYENPFLDSNNKPRIPPELLKDLEHCTEIHHYLHTNRWGKVKKTGLHRAFYEDHELLTDFIKTLALMFEFARALHSCYQAYNVAGIAGSYSLYGKTKDLIIELMKTLEKLCGAISGHHEQVRDKANRLRGDISKKRVRTRSDKRWDLNYGRIFAIDLKIKKSLEDLRKQTELIKKEASESSQEMLEAVTFAQYTQLINTTTPLNEHITAVVAAFQKNAIPSNAHRFTTTTPPVKRALAPSAVRPTRAQSMSFFPPNQAPGGRGRGSAPSTPTLTRHRTGTISSYPQLCSNQPAETTDESMDLTVLRCRNNSITDQSIRFLIELIEDRPELAKLFLSNQLLSGNTANRLWKALSALNTLEKVVISNNPFIFRTSDGTAPFGPSNNMEAIIEFADLLVSQPQLWQLSVAGCNLDLTNISIFANRIVQIPTLEFLDISNNNIGDEGLRFVSEALTKTQTLDTVEYELCPIISELHIINCGLTDAGGETLLDLLRKKPSITTVRILNPGDLESQSQTVTSHPNKFSSEMIGKIAAQVDENNENYNKQSDHFAQYFESKLI